MQTVTRVLIVRRQHASTGILIGQRRSVHIDSNGELSFQPTIQPLTYRLVSDSRLARIQT